jgi:large subunit ribosomal protein L25
MAEELDLVAELRTDTGKGSSRRLRLAGKVPAIIYGAGREPRALTFDHNDLFRAAENESFFSSILNVKVGENIRPSILKDIQIHPAKRVIMHLDLQRIVEGEKIKMTVQIHYLNEEACVGVKVGGGTVQKTRTEVEVSCFPKDLPEYLEVDLETLELDQILHLSDIKLPAEVDLTDLIAEPPRDEAMVTVHVMHVEEEPEEIEEPGEVPAENGGEEEDSEKSED